MKRLFDFTWIVLVLVLVLLAVWFWCVRPYYF